MGNFLSSSRFIRILRRAPLRGFTSTSTFFSGKWYVDEKRINTFFIALEVKLLKKTNILVYISYLIEPYFETCNNFEREDFLQLKNL